MEEFFLYKKEKLNLFLFKDKRRKEEKISR